MNLVQEIQSNSAALAAAGVQDWEACLAALQASKVTAKPIDLGDMLGLMNMSTPGMLTRLPRAADGGEKWTGTVINMVLAEGTSPELQEPLNKFFSHITNDRNKTFNTTDPEFAGLLQLVKSSFADQENMPSTVDFDALIALGGGLKFGDVTAQQIEDAWTEKVNQEATEAASAAIETLRAATRTTWQTVFNTHISSVLDGNSPTLANLIAGVEAALAVLQPEVPG